MRSQPKGSQMDRYHESPWFLRASAKQTKKAEMIAELAILEEGLIA